MPSKRSPWLVQHLYEFLIQWAPLKLAESWDNVGLQIGNLTAELTGVLVSLDVTEAVLWEAVHKNANLLITHHPLFFQPVKCLDDTQITTRLARLAVQMDLNILSFHTNLDATQEGLNDLLAKKLKLQGLKPLMQAASSLTTLKGVGLGRVGKITPMTLEQLAKKTAQNLNLKNLRTVGPKKQILERVAVMTGSGGEFFRQAKAQGAQALITGDIKYHQALDALSEDISLIDIGHFSGEIGMVPLVADRLKKSLSHKTFSAREKLPIFETEMQQDPFEFWNFS